LLTEFLEVFGLWSDLFEAAEVAHTEPAGSKDSGSAKMVYLPAAVHYV
jgi:hypothetical protein